ncbi:Clan CA, family C19, ubiquitin hydrolase-like cysteine peptidase [Trichomonas vaginalis G3]|uniref:Clan CA, family C19, ubiquitin hydrolase-like cysteine peptidase n=1 Tax=Trichomonas vaginalis (strain ATCC PRA-98 / G3) TaxID=412133 RepID=A2DJR2_TRIV3|nr:ubiquitinyl hydrolase protein [Trichomonas vaginalis G3]EAY19276.1 Clan CA, family C19, ubiquitin hydrolase-like cysteine peptidase [Trichomonas vaginalis G3]KAI5527178.1 ubiquitinyl hydrolase protein [Trichomonas vaginalis G3]|eukprot:XP_001580262.1 Clan CA, family C19, ubiquitin hydrolase-like cysteine peptidase [Trichomonas vaginalis G3]
MQSGFRDQMIPFLPQLKGETPRSNSARNVFLVTSAWYRSFISWIEDESNTSPGEVNNTELQAKLQNKEPVEEHVDFEILDKNIAETVFNHFHGGPQILRPLLADPKTQAPTIIIYPIKLIFIYEKENLTSTVHPNWTLEEIKKRVGQRRKFDPSTATFLSDSTNVVIPDDTTAQKIIELFGAKIQVSLPGSMKMNPANHGKTASIASVGSIPGNMRMSIISEGSIFTAFLQCLARIPAFRKAVSSYPVPEQPNENNDTPAIAFVRYFTEIMKQPTAHLNSETSEVSVAYNTAIYMKTDELNAIRHFELASLLHVMLKENIVGEDLFKFKESHCEMCPKCKYCNEYESECSSITVELVKKLFRKAKLEDCLDDYYAAKKGDKNNRWECPQCKKKVLVREQTKAINLPTILVIYVHRFVKESSHDYNYLENELIYGQTLNLSQFTGNSSDKYKLVGSLAHVGHTFTQRYKAFIQEEDGKKWTMFNDNRSRPAPSGSVFEEPLAMIYLRE